MSRRPRVRPDPTGAARHENLLFVTESPAKPHASGAVGAVGFLRRAARRRPAEVGGLVDGSEAV